MQLTVNVWLEDKPGALMRVAGILTAKGSNIRSLNVAPDPWKEGFSRMTLVADVEERLHAKVVSEINRLVNVLHAVDVSKHERGIRPADRTPAAGAVVGC
jgi:acetolactate synthase-1/3 small subunit